MKMLFDNVLIKQEDAVKETKTKSGIFLLSTDNDRYQINDHESILQDLIKKPKTNKGSVVNTGSRCYFYSESDTVIYKKNTEIAFVEADNEMCAVVKEKDILVKVIGRCFFVHPDYVLIKITKEAREALYNKKIKKEDGEEVLLFIQGDKGKDDADANSIFVGSGEVVSVGENIKNIQKGDLGLISYLCDNDESIIVGYEGEDKIIAVKAITTRHSKKLMSYASRRPVKDGKGNPVFKDGKLQTYNRDRIVFDKGDYEELSSLYGVVRGSELIPIEPYVFLQHEETKVMKVGKGGILHEEDEKIIKRKVLSSSKDTIERVNVKAGNVILCDDFDIFNIEFQGKKISAINDVDILGVI